MSQTDSNPKNQITINQTTQDFNLNQTESKVESNSQPTTNQNTNITSKVKSRFKLGFVSNIFNNWKKTPAYSPFLFLGILFVQVITFQNFLQTHFSPDCFMVLYRPFNHSQSSGQGRFLWSALTYFTDKYNFNFTTNQIYFTALAILVNAIAIYYLAHLFLKDRLKNPTNLILATLAGVMVVSNVLVVDIFQFAFMQPAYSLSLIATLVAIHFGVKQKFVLSFLFLVFSLAFYQAWVAIFLPVVLAVNGFGKKNVLKGGIAFTSAWAVDLIYIKLIHPLIFAWVERRALGGDILENAKSIWESFYYTWVESYKILPFYIIFIFGLLTLLGIYQTTKKLDNGYKVVEQILSLFVVVNITAFLPHLASSDPWLSPRSVVGLYAFYGLMVVVLLRFEGFQNNIEQMQKNFFTKLTLISFLILVSLNLVAISRLGADHIYSNRVDRDYVQSYIREMEKYEKLSGKKIVRIVYKLDSAPIWCPPGITCVRDLNVRGLTRPWAVPAIFRYYGKDTEFKPMTDEQANTKFSKQNFSLWEADDYLRFEEDTAFLLIP